MYTPVSVSLSVGLPVYLDVYISTCLCIHPYINDICMCSGVKPCPQIGTT